MKQYILMILCSVSIFSQSETRAYCKTCNEKAGGDPNLKNVKVVNEDDPVCHMKTAEFFFCKRYSRFIKEISMDSVVTIVKRPSRRILINMCKMKSRSKGSLSSLQGLKL